MMESTENLSELWENFLQSKDQNDRIVTDTAQKFIIDFREVMNFHPALSESLAKENTFRSGKEFIETFIKDHHNKKVIALFDNFTASFKKHINELRSEDREQVFFLEGVLRQVSTVHPRIVEIAYVCGGCDFATTHSFLNPFGKIGLPPNCPNCKRNLREQKVKYLDIQKCILEEPFDDVEGNKNPESINIYIEAPLTDKDINKHLSPGNKVRITGIFKSVPIYQHGKRTLEEDKFLHATFVEVVEREFEDIILDPADIARFQEETKQPTFVPDLVQSIAPDIYGYDEIKKALLYQLVGGIRIEDARGKVEKMGDIHILIVSDPGLAKTHLAKSIRKIAPKVRMVDGSGASGVGLTASVIKDEFIGGYVVEAGAIVLADNGLLIIDEFDKINPDDAKGLHLALSDQMVIKDKANIHVEMRARTACLALANPKLGRFDAYGYLADQISFPPSLINRFDLIFPIKDVPDVKRDLEIIKKITAKSFTPDVFQPKYSSDFIKKFVSYVRRNKNLSISDEAVKLLQEYYTDIRTKTDKKLEFKSIPINARQGNTILKLSQASAKLRLDTEVRTVDIRNAIELLQYCLQQFGMDQQTGQFDIDAFEGRIPASTRNNYHVLKEIIIELTGQIGKTIPLEDIMTRAKSKNITEPQAEELITKMLHSGDIIEPRRGFLQLIT